MHEEKTFLAKLRHPFDAGNAESGLAGSVGGGGRGAEKIAREYAENAVKKTDPTMSRLHATPSALVTRNRRAEGRHTHTNATYTDEREEERT